MLSVFNRRAARIQPSSNNNEEQRAEIRDGWNACCQQEALP